MHTSNNRNRSETREPCSDSSSGHTVVRGNGLTIYSIPTPSLDRAGNPIISEGTWEMHIRGGNTPNAKYDAWGMVEEKNIKYETSLDSSTNFVANPLQIKAKVTFGGSTVADANVKVIILKPGENIGDLLATTQTDGGLALLAI